MAMNTNAFFLAGPILIAAMLSGFIFYRIGQQRGTDWCHCVIMASTATTGAGSVQTFRQQAQACDEQYPLR